MTTIIIQMKLNQNGIKNGNAQAYLILFLIYHRGWLNTKCNLSFSLILADISSIYPFSEKSELAKTAKK